MKCAAHNGFVNKDIAIPDFQVEAAIRIGTHPGFVVNRRSLTSKIGQWHQVSRLTLLTLGETELFHEIHLPTEINYFEVYTKQSLLTRASLTLPSLFDCR